MSEPLRLSGIVATAGKSASAYATKDDLATALAGLEGKIAGMLTSMEQSSKKWEHSPLPDPLPVVKEEWLVIDEGMVGVELDKGQIVESIFEDSEPEKIQGLSISQAQSVLVESLRWFELILGCRLMNPWTLSIPLWDNYIRRRVHRLFTCILS